MSDKYRRSRSSIYRGMPLERAEEQAAFVGLMGSGVAPNLIGQCQSRRVDGAQAAIQR